MELLTGLGLAVPAGLNAYIPLLTVAVAQRAGWIALPEPWSLLGATWAIALVAVLLVVEMVADKIPLVDSLNDVIQTLVRPAAGGILFASATLGEIGAPPAVLVAVGVVLAGTVHAAKAVARPAVNAATGGLGGPVVSAAEDAAALALSVAALAVPLVAFAGVVGVAAVLVRRLRRRRAAAPASPAGRSRAGD